MNILSYFRAIFVFYADFNTFQAVFPWVKRESKILISLLPHGKYQTLALQFDLKLRIEFGLHFGNACYL